MFRKLRDELSYLRDRIHSLEERSRRDEDILRPLLPKQIPKSCNTVSGPMEYWVTDPEQITLQHIVDVISKEYYLVPPSNSQLVRRKKLLNNV